MLDECQGCICVGLVSYALWMDMYVFWDDDAMLYAQMYASVYVSQNTSVEHDFIKVKTQDAMMGGQLQG